MGVRGTHGGGPCVINATKDVKLTKVTESKVEFGKAPQASESRCCNLTVKVEVCEWPFDSYTVGCGRKVDRSTVLRDDDGEPKRVPRGRANYGGFRIAVY